MVREAGIYFMSLLALWTLCYFFLRVGGDESFWVRKLHVIIPDGRTSFLLEASRTSTVRASRNVRPTFKEAQLHTGLKVTSA